MVSFLNVTSVHEPAINAKNDDRQLLYWSKGNNEAIHSFFGFHSLLIGKPKVDNVSRICKYKK